MINFYHTQDGRLSVLDPAGDVQAALAAAIWVDLVFPTPEEEALVRGGLGVDVPTREEMQEIEISSRFYDEDGAKFLTAVILSQPNGRDPILAPVTFVLTGAKLVTVRYHSPRSFERFAELAAKSSMVCHSGANVLVGLLESIVDRLADTLEAASVTLDDVSKSIFAPNPSKRKAGAALAQVLKQIGRAEDLNGKLRDSLATINRLVGILSLIVPQGKSDRDGRTRVKTLMRDLQSLAEYSTAQSQKVTFLLDASLGMINIEQSRILGMFSVVAFVFLPPTLIASIYGMNFHSMPELDWEYGYPLAVVAMFVSAILPYLVFKRRGWL
jgi:magnesium transporter